MKKSKTTQQQYEVHPDVQAHFVPLPPLGEKATTEQLEAIFGGDLKALGTIVRLVDDKTKK